MERWWWKMVLCAHARCLCKWSFVCSPTACLSWFLMGHGLGPGRGSEFGDPWPNDQDPCQLRKYPFSDSPPHPQFLPLSFLGLSLPVKKRQSYWQWSDRNRLDNQINYWSDNLINNTQKGDSFYRTHVKCDFTGNLISKSPPKMGKEGVKGIVPKLVNVPDCCKLVTQNKSTNWIFVGYFYYKKQAKTGLEVFICFQNTIK